MQKQMDGMKGAADAFAAAAESYVNWFDEASSRDEVLSDLTELHSILASLQVAVVQLPSKFDLPDDETAIEPILEKRELLSRAALFVPFHDYRVVFDPFVIDQPPVTALLEDDLGDIYAGLIEGLQLFKMRRFPEALWAWRFGYYSHWGRHLVHAQSAIWEYLGTGCVRP